jgi:hypothetical protein
MIDVVLHARNAEPLVIAVVCQGPPKRRQRLRWVFRCEYVPPEIVDNVPIVFR